MITLSRPCPRCGHEKSILSLIWADNPEGAEYDGFRETVVQCVHCRKHSLAVIEASRTFPLAGNAGVNGDISKWSEIRFVMLLPPPAVFAAPEDVPTQIAKAYVEGMAILARNMWTPAAGSFRTSLDRATQVLWASLETSEKMPFKLDARLKKLAEHLSIPAAMMDWADTVRVVGNELHELDDVSQEDTEDAAHFVETFLTYMFTLPRRVARFKERRDAE